MYYGGGVFAAMTDFPDEARGLTQAADNVFVVYRAKRIQPFAIFAEYNLTLFIRRK